MTTVPTPPKHDLGAYISEAFEIYKQDVVNWIIIGLVGTLALGVGYWGGFQICAFKAMRGEKPEISDVLAPFSRFGDYFLPMFLISLALFFLVWFCGLGLVVALLMSTWWFFAYPLIADRGMGWKEATDLSKEVAKQDLVGTFIVSFVAGLVSNIGGFIGLSFITAPLLGIIQAIAYQRTFGAASPAGGAAALPPGGGWGAQPAPAPAAPAGSWGAPAAAPAAPASLSPAPATGWDAPAAPATPIAPTVIDSTPAAAPAPVDQPVETAVQSTTNNPDEIVAGKTMAMSTVDFEKFLKGDNK